MVQPMAAGRPAEAKLKGVIKLQPGSQVQVQGLQNSKELNGLVGHLLEFDAVKLRWGVQLTTGKKIALKMQNLIPMSTQVEAAVEIPNVGPTWASTDTSVPPTASSPQDSADSANAVVADSPPVETSAVAAPEAKDEPVLPAVPAVSVDDSKAAGGGGYDSSSAAGADAGEKAPKKKAVWELAAAMEETPLPVDAPTPSKPRVGFGDEPTVETMEIPANDAAMPQLAPIDNAEEWPVLPTSKETMAKIQSGCWWDGGSAAKRFTEQLRANDPKLTSVVLVPPKRFNEEDANEICDALDVNNICTDLVASGHPLSKESCERVAQMLRTTKTLQSLSIGESSLGELATVLFDGLSKNNSLTGLDLEHKGLTLEVCRSLASALESRKQLDGVPALGSLKLSRNKAIGEALLAKVHFQAPKELDLCECALGPQHGKSLGEWISRGVEVLNLRDNPSFGGEGMEMLMEALLPPSKSSETRKNPPGLRVLRLDGCSIGDDGLEAIAEAFKRGLQVEELYMERCEITLAGCEMLAQALSSRRLHTMSARANVIGDEGCILLAQCAERLDLSSTNLSGQILGTLGEQGLVSLEVFSNPSLGPSVGTWCTALDSSQWQRLELLDLTGCALGDDGFVQVIKTLSERLDLMPNLRDLMIGANDVTEAEEMWELVDALGEARGGKLMTKWCNT